MERRVIAGLIVVGLVIGIWLVWPRGDAPGATSTSAVAIGSSTTSSTVPAAPPTIAPDPSTTTTSATGVVVETVEEAEAILRELWFGWFEGIYNQDEDRIREVVATEEFLRNAIEAFEELEILKEPDAEDIVVLELEILRSDEECLALWTTTDVSSLRGPGAVRSGVDILRRVEGEWKMAAAWAYRDDLWEQDCESLLQPLP